MTRNVFPTALPFIEDTQKRRKEHSFLLCSGKASRLCPSGILNQWSTTIYIYLGGLFNHKNRAARLCWVTCLVITMSIRINLFRVSPTYTVAYKSSDQLLQKITKTCFWSFPHLGLPWILCWNHRQAGIREHWGTSGSIKHMYHVHSLEYSGYSL